MVEPAVLGALFAVAAVLLLHAASSQRRFAVRKQANERLTGLNGFAHVSDGRGPDLGVILVVVGDEQLQ